MAIRLLALVACFGFLSCQGTQGDADDGETYRTTFRYFLFTGNTSFSGEIMPIMSESDLDLIESQTGTTQTAGLGFISGQVTDTAGAAIGGVAIHAHNDSGAAAGPIFYQSGVTGAYVQGLTATSSTGRFVVMNVQIGRVDLKCSAGADGNLYVQVPSGSAVVAQVFAVATGAQPTWAGVTRNLGGTGTAFPLGAEPEVNYQLLGTMSGSVASDDTTGAFSLGTVPARNSFIMKCSKTGFIDTYTYVRTINTNLTASAGGGDVLVTSQANFDNELNATGVTIIPGTGVIRGRVIDSSGGYTVQARNATDIAVGEVRYGDNAINGKPDATLTATQTDGIFYIYNVPPGQVLLRATKTGFSANTYKDSFANGITVPFDLVPTAQPPEPTITVSGALANLQGFAVQSGRIRLHGLGLGDDSDTFGEYTMTNVPAQNVLIIRTSK